jgi:HAE1 family hydrophobic/amphiphilic exporter-1
MSRFALRNPYFIVVVALIATVIGLVSMVRMPVDLFPTINLPVVVVATFFNGMPPEEIETEITGRFERFFTQGSGIEHIESRSLPGVSIIKVYFQPGTDPDADVNTISNLALADLRRLPPGTLPPIVEKFDASSLPVCLITLQGEGLTETQLRDLGQFQVRTQVGTVPGASVAAPPFGGKYRQIMLYVDPTKLLDYNLSPMDVVRAVGNANLILPAGDVKLGPFDYNIYTNSQFHDVSTIDRLPIKTSSLSTITIGDVGHAEDGHAIQTSIVRVDGQPSVYLPILKQGGDTNTIAVVDGVKDVISRLTDTPKSLVATVVFDQSLFVKGAVETLVREGGIGLFLTALMVLIFLGSLRATVAVLLSIPLSALTALIALYFGGSSINSMVLAGLALVFSRLIDNAVIALENIFRHLELGESPAVAAEKGGEEVALAVLAATLTSAVVFFPVTFLYGVSRFLFSALALAVVLALFASYVVAMTVVPLFCARYIHAAAHREGADGAGASRHTFGARFNAAFGRRFQAVVEGYERSVRRALRRPRRVSAGIVALCVAGAALWPVLGLAFFPRTDAGQFVINLKAPSGTRVEATTAIVARVEQIIRSTIGTRDLKLIVSNIGVVPGYSSIYTSNSGPHTATVQVALNDGAHQSSFEYMNRVRQALARDTPEVTSYFSSGGIVDAVLNQGLPAPIDVQVTGSDLQKAFGVASDLASRIRVLPGVSDVYIPQDLDYPSLELDVDRIRASELGLNQKEVVDNVITALSSNGMIAPNYWIDPLTGNDYLLTVQYAEQQIRTLSDLRQIPIRAPDAAAPALLDAVSHVRRFAAPTEVDHYQIQRVFDVYVNTTSEDLGRVAKAVRGLVAQTTSATGARLAVRGMVQGMTDSFNSFGLGLLLSLVLLYLILVAQFRSFVDPLLILLAVPTGVLGVLVMLVATGTTLNVMSLMGILMMVGIVVSNSILIVEFAHRLEEDGLAVRDAIITSCRVRLRPILMTSLATIIGLAPMAFKLGTGSEQYAPLARAIIGGLLASVVLTLYLVPAAYMLLYHRRPTPVRAGGSASQPRQERR